MLADAGDPAVLAVAPAAVMRVDAGSPAVLARAPHLPVRSDAPPPQSSESTHLWRRRPCGDVFLTARGAVGSSLRPCRLLRRRPVPSLLLQVK